MFKTITTLFYKKRKEIENEITAKIKIDEVLGKFLREEILKNSGLDQQFSYTVNKGIIKIETDNKIIAQEIALRIRSLENELRNKGVNFNLIYPRPVRGIAFKLFPTL